MPDWGYWSMPFFLTAIEILAESYINEFLVRRRCCFNVSLVWIFNNWKRKLNADPLFLIMSSLFEANSTLFTTLFQKHSIMMVPHSLSRRIYVGAMDTTYHWKWPLSYSKQAQIFGRDGATWNRNCSTIRLEKGKISILFIKQLHQHIDTRERDSSEARKQVVR